MSKKFVYRNGYGKPGYQSWLSKWMDRNNFTIPQAYRALDLSAVTFRKYLQCGRTMPMVIVYCAKCIEAQLPPCEDSFSLWREKCGYSISGAAILFNLSTSNIYRFNNKKIHLTRKMRLAMAYVLKNPVKPFC